MMRMRKEKVCYCCPECGKYSGKSAIADTDLVCGKCGTPFVVLVEQGKITIFKDNRHTDRRTVACAN